MGHGAVSQPASKKRIELILKSMCSFFALIIINLYSIFYNY